MPQGPDPSAPRPGAGLTRGPPTPSFTRSAELTFRPHSFVEPHRREWLNSLLQVPIPHRPLATAGLVRLSEVAMDPWNASRGSSPASLRCSCPPRFVPLLLFLSLVCGVSAARSEVAAGGPEDPSVLRRVVYPLPGVHADEARPAEPVASRAPLPYQATVVPHPTNFIPITGLPTEDVDLVEVSTPGAPVPFTAVFPTEGAVHFIDEAAEVEYATIPTLSPNISGTDFESNGTIGVFATLGYIYIYDMNVPKLKFAVALPGTPARRDIDPKIIFGGGAVIYATGTEIHSINTTSGVINWTTTLPSPVVEAVDPVINSAQNMLFVPTEGFMTAINPGTGA